MTSEAVDSKGSSVAGRRGQVPKSVRRMHQKEKDAGGGVKKPLFLASAASIGNARRDAKVRARTHARMHIRTHKSMTGGRNTYACSRACACTQTHSHTPTHARWFLPDEAFGRRKKDLLFGQRAQAPYLPHTHMHTPAYPHAHTFTASWQRTHVRALALCACV